MKKDKTSFWVTSRRRKILSFIFIVIIAGGFGIYTLLPIGMPDGEDYFKPVGERKLLSDEKGHWAYTRRLYAGMEATGDTFAGWDTSQQPMWKYYISFTGYSMPSLALIEPENKENIIYNMWVMIKKMKSKKVWMDWLEFGFGEDPITYHNIMYKGYLNLMYGLYQLMSGDIRFSREYTWLTQQIVKEIQKLHKEGVYAGVTCQPNQYFVQCNAVNLMSLHIYDKLYGTSYLKNEGKWVIEFIHQRMVDPKTGLYWMEYHPSHDTVERYLSGYTNAMTSIFMKPFEPEFNENVYKKFKELFVVEIGPFAYAKEFIDGGPSPVATLFAIWAAKEYKDVDLFTKLRNAVDKKGKLKKSAFSDAMVYKEFDNVIQNPVMLLAKIHMGWDTILNHDWGNKQHATIPDTHDMIWKNILPQDIHEKPGLAGDLEGL